MVVFSLTGWSPRIPTKFHVLRGTPDTAGVLDLSLTGLSPSLTGLSSAVLLKIRILFAVHTPECMHSGLGSSAFARRYLRNHSLFSLPLPT